MLRMAGIVSQPQPLKGLQKQRGYASQTVAFLNKEPLLFTEEPERAIFIHRLHVTAAAAAAASFFSVTVKLVDFFMLERDFDVGEAHCDRLLSLDVSYMSKLISRLFFFIFQCNNFLVITLFCAEVFVSLQPDYIS